MLNVAGRFFEEMEIQHNFYENDAVNGIIMARR